MNKYEEEVYNYFTDESNFRKMVKVAQHASSVKSTLLQEFWDAIIVAFNIRIAESYNEWELNTHGSINYNWGKILVHKRSHTERGDDNLPIVAVGIQRIMDNQYSFYGIFLNNKAPKYDINAIVEYIRDIEELKDFEKDNDLWWPRWNQTGLDLRKEEDYVKILPANRNLIVNAITDSIFNMLQQVSHEFDIIYKMAK